ncbi:hypothetical protein HY464_00310 [Candidatus Peregrinibacteria bacterium]|nr:hypothetical protein [Candidatus Peregrinibacteria bacterium]
MDGSAPATKADIQLMQKDLQGVKTEMQVVQKDLQGVKTEMQVVQKDLQGVKTDIQRLERKFDEKCDRLERKFERLYETDDQILAILGNIDKRLTPKVEDHERRITQLEEVVA